MPKKVWIVRWKDASRRSRSTLGYHRLVCDSIQEAQDKLENLKTQGIQAKIEESETLGIPGCPI